MKRLTAVFITACMVFLLSSPNAFAKPKPTKGEKLYNSKCKGCHGKGAVGKAAANIQGKTASDISAAIAIVKKMKKLCKLKSPIIDEIAGYLATQAP